MYKYIDKQKQLVVTFIDESILLWFQNTYDDVVDDDVVDDDDVDDVDDDDHNDDDDVDDDDIDMRDGRDKLLNLSINIHIVITMKKYTHVYNY